MIKTELILGDCKEKLVDIADNSIDLIFTSPPYADQRKDTYGGVHPDKYVEWFLPISEQLLRVLKTDGTFILNIKEKATGGQRHTYVIKLILSLKEQGWLWTEEFIWCLSGGTKLYVKYKNKEFPIKLKELVRSYKFEDIQLWNGQKWSQVKNWEKSICTNPIQIELRSGEKISCTPNHHFPTKEGLKRADQLKIGDLLESCKLPEPKRVNSPAFIPDEIGWLIGLYIAEGSRSQKMIQISGHVLEDEYRISKLKKIVEGFGSDLKVHNYIGNASQIIFNGTILNSIIDFYVNGKNAHTKCLSARCWNRNNIFLDNLLQGYFDGDGHWDKKNNRWRLGFCRNYALAEDLRTLCARLGYSIRLIPSRAKLNGKKYLSYCGEIRIKKSESKRSKCKFEIIKISSSKWRHFWDIEVEDDPHLFALSSGILTHNSKKNCFPGKWPNRFRDAWERLLQFNKNKKFNMYQEEVMVPMGESTKKRLERLGKNDVIRLEPATGSKLGKNLSNWVDRDMAYPTNVLYLPTESSNRGHSAVFPRELPTWFIKLFTKSNDLVLDPFVGSGTTLFASQCLSRNSIGIEKSTEEYEKTKKNLDKDIDIFKEI